MRKQLCVWILVWLCFGVEAQTNFTDSLHLIVHHQKVVNVDGKNRLQFDISVYRPNDNWNGGDVFMGDADFYFMFNESAFSRTKDPELVDAHAAIGVGGGSNALTATASTWWASAQRRLRVSVRKATGGGDGVYPELFLKDTVFIAQVQWEMALGNRDPQIQWDMAATGVLSSKNYPVIPTFIGDVEKYPDPGIFIDTLSVDQDGNRWACAGSDVLFYVQARSTGDDIRYQWQYALDGGGWNNFANTPGAHSVSNPAFDYLIHGAGDTIVVRHAPGVTDGMRLQCVVSDPTLAAGDNERVTEEMTLLLRDSIRVFMSPAENGLKEGSALVGMCPGATGKEVRLNIVGPTNGEEGELGEVYVNYYFVGESGSMAMYSDTIRSFTNHYTEAGVGEIYTKNITVTEPGTYFIADASTSHCYNVEDAQWDLGGVALDTLICNAASFVKYDTLMAHFSASPDTTMLDRYSIAMGADTNLMVGTTGMYNVFNIYDQNNTPYIGDVITSSKDTVYRPKSSGLDTVYYVKSIDGCDEVSMREIEVIENYYAQIKVFLEGPMTRDGAMRCFTIYTLPTDDAQTVYRSTYADVAEVPSDRFETNPSTYEKNLPDGVWCDWIYVKIRDAERNSVYETSALLRNDGVICNLEGEPYIALKNVEGDMAYELIVEHRNHLSIMGATPYTFSSSKTKPTEIDLTRPENVYTSGGKEPLSLSSSGLYCMYGGDLNQDGVVSVSDITVLAMTVANKGIYIHDLNHDGAVATTTDVVLIKSNNSKAILFTK